VEHNGVFGETGMFGDLPRSATAVAASPLELLRIPRDVFHKVLHDNPAAARCLATVLAQRLSRTTERLSEEIAFQCG